MTCIIVGSCHLLPLLLEGVFKEESAHFHVDLGGVLSRQKHYRFEYSLEVITACVQRCKGCFKGVRVSSILTVQSWDYFCSTRELTSMFMNFFSIVLPRGIFSRGFV